MEGFKDYKVFFNQLFANVNNQVKKMAAKSVGSTCCLFYRRSSVGYVANLGDTRAVMNVGGKAVRLSVDHKGYNEDEQMRVRRCGGQVMRGRLMGQLAVTRSFGDFDYANCGLICQPDINRFELKGNEKYLIIATDGLWDVVDDQVREGILIPLESRRRD